MDITTAYREWIAANVNGTGYGECAEVTEAMAAAFPELRRVPGHYYCGEECHRAYVAYCTNPMSY
jgi:hypothetical protein